MNGEWLLREGQITFMSITYDVLQYMLCSKICKSALHKTRIDPENFVNKHTHTCLYARIEGLS